MAKESEVRAPNLDISARADSSRTLPGWAFTDQAVFRARAGSDSFSQLALCRHSFRSSSKPGIDREHRRSEHHHHPWTGRRASRLLQCLPTSRARAVTGRGHVHRITCPYHAWTSRNRRPVWRSAGHRLPPELRQRRLQSQAGTHRGVRQEVDFLCNMDPRRFLCAIRRRISRRISRPKSCPLSTA